MFVSQVLSTIENEFGSQPRGVISHPKEAKGMLHPHIDTTSCTTYQAMQTSFLPIDKTLTVWYRI